MLTTGKILSTDCRANITKDEKIRFARAIEAEVLQAQGPVAWAYTINNSHSVFSADKPPEDAYDDGTLYPLYAAPQPPAPLDESRYCPDCEALQAKVAEQSAEIERLMKLLTCYKTACVSRRSCAKLSALRDDA